MTIPQLIGLTEQALDDSAERRKKTQLNILQSIRKKLKSTHREMSQSPYRTGFQRKTQGKGIVQQKKKKSKNKISERQQSRKDTRGKSLKMLQRKMDIPRQTSQKALHDHGHKKLSIGNIGINKLRIQNSKEIMKEIEMEKMREETRRQQMQGVTGIQARRLQKIHMIERLESEKRLNSLRSLQEGIIQARGSLP